MYIFSAFLHRAASSTLMLSQHLLIYIIYVSKLLEITLGTYTIFTHINYNQMTINLDSIRFLLVGLVGLVGWLPQFFLQKIWAIFWHWWKRSQPNRLSFIIVGHHYVSLIIFQEMNTIIGRKGKEYRTEGKKGI